MQKTIVKAGYLFGLLAVFLCALPFLYAFGFCFPRGDDFDEITRAMFLFDLPGGLYEICREWLYWSGRYTYHFLAVFLGRAAESRITCGIVCASILFLYAVAAYAMARTNRARRKSALFLGAMFMTSVCASWLYPESFYIQTDALTIVLQGVAFLFFFIFLCRLWKSTGHSAKTNWLYTLGWGIFAIGIYEHSALAVFWTTLGAVLLALYKQKLDPGQTIERNSSRWAGYPARAKSFLRLLLWFSCAIAFSFLAPGNFQRNHARGITPDAQLEQLGSVLHDFVAALLAFAASPWLWLAPCMALFLAILCRANSRPRRLNLPLLAICAACTICLGLSIICLHALSDVPFSMSAKFASSLNLYAACAIIFILFLLFTAHTFKRFLLKAKFALCAILTLAFCLSIAHTHNFQLTAINAINGRLLLAGHFLETRTDYLTQTGILCGGHKKLPPFGLLGEIQNPNSRKRKVEPGLPAVEVAAGTLPVFPVFLFHKLAPTANGWPNLWAAWVYGLGSLRASFPVPDVALQQIATGNAPELWLPETLRKAGIKKAWRMQTQGANPTFASDWLIFELEENASAQIAILRPNPVMPGRLAPVWLQKQLLEHLLARKETKPDLSALLAASMLHEKPLIMNNMHIFRAGQAMPETTPWPSAIFVSVNGGDFQRLMPPG